MPGSKLYRRFDAFDRVLHIGLMASFLGLAITGLPLFFSTSAWASRIAHALGGFHAAGILHRSAATLLMTVFAVHVGRILKRLFRDQDLGMLWGPRSMVPQPRDVADLFKHVRWFLGKGQRPRFDQVHLLGEVRLLGGLLGHGDHRPLGADAVVPDRLRAPGARAGCSTSPCSCTAKRRCSPWSSSSPCTSSTPTCVPRSSRWIR